MYEYNCLLIAKFLSTLIDYVSKALQLIFQVVRIDRARLSQEYGQGLVCIRAPILNRTKTLNIFNELKYSM